ncbi:MAG TPA: hypothetical protein VFR34_01010 [Paracoccaceae bacterium]|nr:hypothetical protein [Paracoccaceae bacterium]
MSKLGEIEARLDDAISRIEAALGASYGGGDGAAIMAKMRQQADEIAALRAELEHMREERRRDAEDVTAILADLRPLLEG